MSDLTEILIEKLQLQRILCERVFIKWEDQSGESCTLGSRTKNNKKDLKLLMAAYCDEEGHVHIHFSIKVSISRDGKKHEKEMLLVVPPDADFSKALTPCSISTINALSRLDAAAIHDAGISDSVHVIYLPFDLITEGFVVRNTTSALKPKPWNRPSQELIRRFVSLSNTKIFTVYITPNDYARVGLKGLHDRLSKTSTATNTRTNNMMEMYIQQGGVLVESSRLDPELPPQYTENPPQPLPEVQVPRSPPIIFEQKTLSINTFETAIAETPARIPATPNSIVVHSIFSPICEELSDGEVDWDDIEETWRNVEEASRNIEIDPDIDSDQEGLVNLNSRDPSQQFNSREQSQQFNCDSEVSKILESKFAEWMETAGQINPNIHEHKRLITKLLILGNCIRTSNSGVFDATIFWCSTIFFYDPFDSDISPELWERNLWLLSDMARLIKWANKVHYSAEMNPLLVDHFLKLGDTARTTALHPEYSYDSYERQKRVCTTQVIIKLGKPVIGISGETSKPVPRKHLGTDSNTSKRVKI
ncbi:hypothetical protein ACHAO8_011400 [Botrytis cinerea]